ncbi:MAG: hypothetical protein COU29_03635 [Candidatus Magasanikbacteria bacterium CG10_big_fil_rev_8_21_14_0_10_36_32]|uniref:Peptidase S1 domain-containing protein n=1 Tax=Candidatus Magasanikbacteria bacterium CG10_big_fil_rev_8_21_14_0_10_36_32 TaxID=1974646 RepID=A0A2M6W5J2_9BACT|nr:MAG: hypothetical protein COU29_03635 [Candidatus Magasanikbacteria bacterium CG10_big_fil_rev_8_21_14_0_10_36_32]
MEKKMFGFVMFIMAFVCAMMLSGCGAVSFYSGSNTVINASGNSHSVSVLEKDMESAVALLYAKKDDGQLRMFCTATAFERSGKTYRFVTAAHCVAEDINGMVELVPYQWFISFDEPGVKTFYPAKLLGVGYQSRGDDFAVLETTLDRQIPVIPMSATDAELGEQVSNVASPLGLGKQLFRGHVTTVYMDRPVVGAGLNWTGATLLQISCGPGSSGSSVVSQNRHTIVSILVGMIYRGPAVFIVSIPVTKFNRFWRDIQTNKYPWYAPAFNANGIPVSTSSSQRDLSNFMNRIDRGLSVVLEPEPTK